MKNRKSNDSCSILHQLPCNKNQEKKERKRLSLSMVCTHSLLISMQKRSGGKKNTRELCRKSKEAES